MYLQRNNQNLKQKASGRTKPKITNKTPTNWIQEPAEERNTHRGPTLMQKLKHRTKRKNKLMRLQL